MEGVEGVEGVFSAGLLPQAAKLSSIARVNNSAKIFFILKKSFLFSAGQCIIYLPTLIFGIGVGNAPV